MGDIVIQLLFSQHRKEQSKNTKPGLKIKEKTHPSFKIIETLVTENVIIAISL